MICSGYALNHGLLKVRGLGQYAAGAISLTTLGSEYLRRKPYEPDKNVFRHWASAEYALTHLPQHVSLSVDLRRQPSRLENSVVDYVFSHITAKVSDLSHEFRVHPAQVLLLQNTTFRFD